MRLRFRKVPERGGRGEGELGENTCLEDRGPKAGFMSVAAGEEEDGGDDALEGGGGGGGGDEASSSV